MTQKPGWKELEEGGKILEPGNSVNYKTGDWRSFRPVVDFKKCIQCLQCWVFCPDGCIPADDGKREETNLDFCKGCGICANICPAKCIEMKDENEFK